MTDKIALIAIDWGTTNRRGWALARDGRVLDEKADSGGLLSASEKGFLPSFLSFTEGWRNSGTHIPTLLCGMVGSKMGWIEAPYLSTPLDLERLASGLCPVPDVERVWIVPGVSDDSGPDPDVIRGEECQILGAVLTRNVENGLLVLPGTHSKWVLVKDRRLMKFRTYMTGEIFELLKSSGTLSQLMRDSEWNEDAFAQGVKRAKSGDGELLHSLFTVRTLGLFARIPQSALASYLSGLLIGAEFSAALNWTNSRPGQRLIAIGSPHLLDRYKAAAAHFGQEIVTVDSRTLVPAALAAIANAAEIFS